MRPADLPGRHKKWSGAAPATTGDNNRGNRKSENKQLRAGLEGGEERGSQFESSEATLLW